MHGDDEPDSSTWLDFLPGVLFDLGGILLIFGFGSAFVLGVGSKTWEPGFADHAKLARNCEIGGLGLLAIGGAWLAHNGVRKSLKR